jgi:hypothetical protein
MLMLIPGLARAAEDEVRQFTVFIDNKEAGKYRMAIQRLDDGTTHVHGTADVRARILLVYTYTYSYRGTEVWKDGRLLRLDSSANDNGTKFTVNATAEDNALRVRVNGQEHVTRGDAWTTTYWHLPGGDARGRPLTLLDADTGRELNGQLQYLGTNMFFVGGQRQNCSHYRLTGKEVLTRKDVMVDLWYDAQERLVRQEFLEDGHRTVLELAGVHR